MGSIQVEEAVWKHLTEGEKANIKLAGYSARLK